MNKYKYTVHKTFKWLDFDMFDNFRAKMFDIICHRVEALVRFGEFAKSRFRFFDMRVLQCIECDK